MDICKCSVCTKMCIIFFMYCINLLIFSHKLKFSIHQLYIKQKQQIRNNKKWTDTELHYMATVIYYKQSAFKER